VERLHWEHPVAKAGSSKKQNLRQLKFYRLSKQKSQDIKTSEGPSELHCRLGSAAAMEDAATAPRVFLLDWTDQRKAAARSLPPPAQGWGDLVPMATAGARTIPGRNGSG
jgi:hypothetical protein